MKAGILFAALLLGCVAAYLVPSDRVLLLILPPFIACIVLGWYVAFQNKAIHFGRFTYGPFHVRSWPLIDITTPVRNSKALRALLVVAAFLAGGCLGLLLQVWAP